MTGRSAQLIRQTLDGVVTPSVRDAILAGALRISALGKIPDEPEELSRFVLGPLRGALVRGLGPELAASILDEIQRATLFDDELAPATSRSPRRQSSRAPRSLSPPPRRNTPTHRPSSPRRTPSTPPSARSPRAPTPPPYSGPISNRKAPWGSDEYPAGGMLGLDDRTPSQRAPGKTQSFVLVLSSDSSMIERLMPWLEGRTEVAQVESMREFLLIVDSLNEGRVAVVVDCRRPSIQPTAIAALAEELPPNVNVILLAPNAEQQRRLRAVSDAVSRFIVLRGDVRPREIAQRCATLVG